MKQINWLIAITILIWVIIFFYSQTVNEEILSLNDIGTIKNRAFIKKCLWLLSLFLLIAIYFKTNSLNQIFNQYLNYTYLVIHYLSLILIVIIGILLFISFFTFWI
jgi:hypothetical protein